MRLSVFLIVASLVISFNSYSKNKEFPIAKVSKIKGVATVLAPHSMEAKNLVIGDFLLEESSVVTEEKSFVRIQFNDGSIVSLGPNSKIVIEPTGKEKGTSLLNLLKGQLRAQVEKEEKKEKVKGDKTSPRADGKFFIKTRSAALGVRGTTFQAIYEPSSMRTGLLTFKGEVAIKKIEPGELSKKVESVPEVRVEKFKKILEATTEDTKIAKIGDYTNLSPLDSAPSAPVKIDPTQLTLLKKDDSLGVEKVKVDMKEVAKEASEVKKAYAEAGVKEGSLNQAEIKQLGLVDTKSGFYIPPTDKKANVEIGQIGKNGQYIPPKGLKIDPNKGFVAQNEDDKDAEAKISKLNPLIEKQTVPDLDNPYYKKYFDVESD